MIKKENYFDNCATTRCSEENAEIMKKCLVEGYFNPSSLSESSTEVFFEMEDARKTILRALGGESGSLIFTASGSEGDNTAIFGSVKSKRGNIVTSMVEHPAVYNAIKHLKDGGEDVRYAPLKADGSVDVDRLCEVVDEKTQFVSLMHVNNETGAVTDIKNAVKVVRSIAPKAVFMSDGVQAFMKLPVNVESLGVDLYTISAHKIHAPKGLGGLWIRKGVNISPLVYGGGQERGYRGGTENVGGILCFARSVSEIKDKLEAYAARYAEYKRIIIEKLSDFSDMLVICPEGASNICSVMFSDIRTEVIMHMMEDRGFIVGTGSACSSKHRTNRIAQAVGLPKKYHEGLVRISFSKENTTESVCLMADALAEALRTFRGIK